VVISDYQGLIVGACFAHLGVSPAKTKTPGILTSPGILTAPSIGRIFAFEWAVLVTIPGIVCRILPIFTTDLLTTAVLQVLSKNKQK
jgi:hypothetical protein